MTISEQIGKDIVAAMKAKQEPRLTTLRMVKAALKNKEIDKRSLLDAQEEMAVLNTMIKQRRESIEQFVNGNRQELADKEQAEIGIIEAYLPKAVGAEEVTATVKAAIEEMTAAGKTPTQKDLGTVMKAALAKFQASGARVDGKAVNEEVRRQLAGA